MRRGFWLTALSLVLSSWLLPSQAQATEYLIGTVGKGPKGLKRMGCDVVAKVPEIKMMAVDCAGDDVAAELAGLSGVQGVTPNLFMQFVDPPADNQFVSQEEVGNPPNSGDNDFFFDLQWGHDAVNAPEAWAAGARGAGARVAVLDSGVWAPHWDLWDKIDYGLSYSFVPGEDWVVSYEGDLSHGTHVAGTIAGNDNGFGVVGVAPDAEIVAVKVLSEYDGSGSFLWIIQGIIYAALIDADVINMSLGGWVPRFSYVSDNGTPDDPSDDFRVTADQVNWLITFVDRAVTFAYQNGTTVLAAAGNDSWDRDHDPAWTHLPSDCANAIAISATGPQGWAVDSSTSLDVPAFYTNYGQRAIDFAGPGGNVDWGLYDAGADMLCTVAGVTRPCWVFDLVFSADIWGWSWALGTSMATPHAAGVAALVIGANGGSMHPAQVQATLMQSADDLGMPGRDDWYGLGRLNALNAVQ